MLGVKKIKQRILNGTKMLMKGGKSLSSSFVADKAKDFF